MAYQRTLPEKVQDVKTTFAQFAEWLTADPLRQLTDQANEAASLAATQGDYKTYAEMVQARIQVQRVVSANDRAALFAAVMATQSGVARPNLGVSDDTD
jgi:hypothetical protein